MVVIISFLDNIASRAGYSVGTMGAIMGMPGAGLGICRLGEAFAVVALPFSGHERRAEVRPSCCVSYRDFCVVAIPGSFYRGKGPGAKGRLVLFRGDFLRGKTHKADGCQKKGDVGKRKQGFSQGDDVLDAELLLLRENDDAIGQCDGEEDESDEYEGAHDSCQKAVPEEKRGREVGDQRDPGDDRVAEDEFQSGRVEVQNAGYDEKAQEDIGDTDDDFSGAD